MAWVFRLISTGGTEMKQKCQITKIALLDFDRIVQIKICFDHFDDVFELLLWKILFQDATI